MGRRPAAKGHPGAMAGWPFGRTAGIQPVPFIPLSVPPMWAIAVGPGGRDETGRLIPIDLEVGDRVLFGKWSGTEVKIDGIEYLIMKESDIMGVFDESDRAQSQAYALSVRAQIAIILIF